MGKREHSISLSRDRGRMIRRGPFLRINLGMSRDVAWQKSKNCAQLNREQMKSPGGETKVGAVELRLFCEWLWKARGGKLWQSRCRQHGTTSDV